MELSDYDILGVTDKASFRLVKNAYHELSRIYHPDSSQIIIGMTKDDKEIAFQKIQTAYENIKKKMNVVEVDLPENEIKYKVDIITEKVNNIEIDSEDFIKKFNNEFEIINKNENKDNPYSIFYNEPDESKRNMNDSKIILKDSSSNKSSNTFEFGINYIEDHSTDKYHDLNKLFNSENNFNSLDSHKESIDSNLNKKLDELLKQRGEKIVFSEEDINFMNRQKKILMEIEDSKIEIENNRRITLLK